MLVTIREKWTSRYLMMVDLDAIERSCGVKIKDPNYGTWRVDLSVSQTKRIFKYIHKHLHDVEQLIRIENFMDETKNTKMRKAWLDTAEVAKR